MRDSKNIQAAESTTAASATSADAIKTAALTGDDREFLRVYRTAGRRDRAMIGHLLLAYDAGNRRSVFEWLYHWAAFAAINPRKACKVSPTLRRIAQISMILAAVGVMLLLSACSGADGRSVQDLRTLAGMTPQPVAATPPADRGKVAKVSTPTPTDQPAQIGATDTPDMQPQALSVMTMPAQISEATQTPQPVAYMPACNPQTPAPVMTLDASDIAAGVILKGGASCEAVQP